MTDRTTPASELVLAGVSDRTAPVELRERLALTRAQATSVLGDLVAQPPVREALALSAGGRTELYALTSMPVAARAALLGALAARAGVRPKKLADQVQFASGREAVEHLFRLAAGLESAPFGELAIFGRLRRARALAHEAHAVSRGMAGIVDRALTAGKLARKLQASSAGSHAAVDAAALVSVEADRCVEWMGSQRRAPEAVPRDGSLVESVQHLFSLRAAPGSRRA